MQQVEETADSSSGKRMACELCHKLFLPKGLPSHRSACKRKLADAAQDLEYETELAERSCRSRIESASAAMESLEDDEDGMYVSEEDLHRDPEILTHDAGEGDDRMIEPEDSPQILFNGQSTTLFEEAEHAQHPQPPPAVPIVMDSEIPETADPAVYVNPARYYAQFCTDHHDAPRHPQKDTIMRVPHPKSMADVTVSPLEDYVRKVDATVEPKDEEPWRPFASRIDFEFAEFAAEAHLSRPMVERLLRLASRLSSGDSGFSLKSFAMLEEVWERASHLQTPFRRDEIQVAYKKEKCSFELYSRSLWDWVKDQLSDPSLIPFTDWYAHQMFKFDGQKWTRFTNEPLTANRCWRTQWNIPAGGTPLCLILYADKTRLSSFGTAKGYPVVARIANFKINICNGEGVGGGRVVGWLPIVNDDADEKNKPLFTNFKRIVWHQSFLTILDTIMKHSKDGCAFKCADDILRILYPLILILSADYEEQCVMALIKGVNGKCPCPICLIPATDLRDLINQHRLRSSSDGQVTMEDETLRRTAQDVRLKPLGLRAIKNAFWQVANSDPHQAIAFDRLHANHSGLFGKHLWVEFQDIVKNMSGSRAALGKIDDQMALMPRWRNLNHFKNIMEVHFTDGSKYEDISKLIIFAAHNVLTEANSTAGYALLRCIRSYLEHDMYLAFELHTEDTLAAARAVLPRFDLLLKKYSRRREEKNWAFPKLHWQSHAFRDIEEKGVTANTSTKPNEKMHGPFKDTFALQTNFKNVAPQLLKVDHRLFVATTIREKLNTLDTYLSRQCNSDDESLPEYEFGRIHLGSPEKPSQLQAVEDALKPLVQNFRTMLLEYLKARYLIQNYSGGTHRDTNVEVRCDELIREFHFIKIQYSSLVTWKAQSDYLRCSPSFHGLPRYDGVIVDDGIGHYSFGILKFVFVCTMRQLNGISLRVPLALINPLVIVSGRHTRKDAHLCLYRVRASEGQPHRLIHAESIIRGAYLIADTDNPIDYFAVDSVDTDMFLRLKLIFRPEMWTVS